MSKTKCGCNSACSFDCSLLAIGASVIIGIITTLLTITATITITPAFLWVLFGIAVVYLGVVLLVSSGFGCRSNCRCLRTPLSLLLAGILGTILGAIILLGITFAATSIVGAVITGALLFFFALLITSTVCLIKCFSGLEDTCDNSFEL